MDYSFPCLLKDVKIGDFLIRKPTSTKVFTREAYDHSIKRFCLSDVMDTNKSLYLKGNTIVYIGFTY